MIIEYVQLYKMIIEYVQLYKMIIEYVQLYYENALLHNFLKWAV